MRTIRVPAALHELFGRRTTLLEMGLTLTFSAVLSVLLLSLTFDEWNALAIWRAAVILLLTVDITGGVVANFTYSTNDHYRTYARLRLAFIAMHVQPILIAWLLGDGILTSLAVWSYTVLSALLVNALIAHPAQRQIAAALAVTGITLLLLLAEHSMRIALALYAFYIFKVIFSFAVDHYAARKDL